MNVVEGDRAPDFELPDQNGKFHKLSDYKGKWLLLYFYPKDFTPGCTKEACSFRDNYFILNDKLEVIGISRDSVKSHKNFSVKYNLPFTILSDSKRVVINNYGADGAIFAKRSSFLINPKGFIEKIYKKVNPSDHVSQIISDISSL